MKNLLPLPHIQHYRLQTIKQQKLNIEIKFEQLNSKLLQSSNSETKLNNEISTNNIIISNLKSRNEALQAEITSLHDDKQILNVKNDKLNKESHKLKMEIDLMQENNQQLLEQNTNLQQQLSSLHADITSLNEATLLQEKQIGGYKEQMEKILSNKNNRQTESFIKLQSFQVQLRADLQQIRSMHQYVVSHFDYLRIAFDNDIQNVTQTLIAEYKNKNKQLVTDAINNAVVKENKNVKIIYANKISLVVNNFMSQQLIKLDNLMQEMPNSANQPHRQQIQEIMKDVGDEMKSLQSTLFKYALETGEVSLYSVAKGDHAPTDHVSDEVNDKNVLKYNHHPEIMDKTLKLATQWQEKYEICLKELAMKSETLKVQQQTISKLKNQINLYKKENADLARIPNQLVDTLSEMSELTIANQSSDGGDSSALSSVRKRDLDNLMKEKLHVDSETKETLLNKIIKLRQLMHHKVTNWNQSELSYKNKINHLVTQMQKVLPSDVASRYSQLDSNHIAEIQKYWLMVCFIFHVFICDKFMYEFAL